MEISRRKLEWENPEYFCTLHFHLFSYCEVRVRMMTLFSRSWHDCGRHFFLICLVSLEQIAQACRPCSFAAGNETFWRQREHSSDLRRHAVTPCLQSLLHCWFRAVEFHPVQGTIEKKVIQTKQNPLCLNIWCLVDMNGWWYDMWYHWYHDSDVHLCYGANLKSSNPVFWQIWQIWQCRGAMVWLVTDFPTNHRLRSQATKRRTGLCTALVLFQGKMHCEHRGIYPGRLMEQLSDILDGISLPWCCDVL